MTVTWKVPENEGGYYKMPRMHEEPSRFRWRPKAEVPVWKIRDVVRMRAI